MPFSVALSPTGTPKRNLVEMAFEDCGSAGYEFERTPEEVASALRRLDTMMREWPWERLGYVQGGSVEDVSGIPDHAIGAVASYLALRIAPTMGATLSPEARTAMTRSFNLVLSRTATIPVAQMPGGTLRGAGSHSRSTPYIETA